MTSRHIMSLLAFATTSLAVPALASASTDPPADTIPSGCEEVLQHIDIDAIRDEDSTTGSETIDHSADGYRLTVDYLIAWNTHSIALQANATGARVSAVAVDWEWTNGEETTAERSYRATPLTNRLQDFNLPIGTESTPTSAVNSITFYLVLCPQTVTTPPASGGGSLPKTGSNSTIMLAAMALLLVGGAAAGIVRRSPRQPAVDSKATGTR